MTNIKQLAEAVDRSLHIFEVAAHRYVDACKAEDQASRSRQRPFEHPTYGHAINWVHKAVQDRLARLNDAARSTTGNERNAAGQSIHAAAVSKPVHRVAEHH